MAFIFAILYFIFYMLDMYACISLFTLLTQLADGISFLLKLHAKFDLLHVPQAIFIMFVRSL